VRQDLPQVAQIKSGLPDVDLELRQVAVVADCDLEPGLGLFNSPLGLLERYVFWQRLYEVDSLLFELLDAGARLIYVALETMNLVELLKINWHHHLPRSGPPHSRGSA
jgi:hypothetical protein